MEVMGYSSMNSTLKDLHESRLRRSVERTDIHSRLTFTVRGCCLQIKEHAGLSIGSHVWGGSKALARYMETQYSALDFKDKRILEVGSGCGLLGISIAKLAKEAKSIVLTDRGDLSLLSSNVRDNCTEKNITVERLEWRGPYEQLRRHMPFHYIFAADVVYDPDAFEDLKECLVQLAGRRTLLFLAYKERSPDERSFFEVISGYFECIKLFRQREKGDKRDTVIFIMKRRPFSSLEGSLCPRQEDHPADPSS